VAFGTPVVSDGGGNFNLTGTYICPAAPNDQVYLVATGGDPGGGTNANLALMAAPGTYSGLSSGSFISINEVTTVAAAYALSGFMTDYQARRQQQHKLCWSSECVCYCRQPCEQLRWSGMGGNTCLPERARGYDVSLFQEHRSAG
jgi:hypothetical protein